MTGPKTEAEKNDVGERWKISHKKSQLLVQVYQTNTLCNDNVIKLFKVEKKKRKKLEKYLLSKFLIFKQRSYHIFSTLSSIGIRGKMKPTLKKKRKKIRNRIEKEISEETFKKNYPRYILVFFFFLPSQFCRQKIRNKSRQ